MLRIVRGRLLPLRNTGGQQADNGFSQNVSLVPPVEIHIHRLPPPPKKREMNEGGEERSLSGKLLDGLSLLKLASSSCK